VPPGDLPLLSYSPADNCPKRQAQRGQSKSRAIKFEMIDLHSPYNSPTEPGPEQFWDPEAAENDDRRILIVDDEQSIRQLFSTYLGETYLCETAGDAQAALDALERQQFGLVLTDVHMPGLGGIELLRRVVDLYPDTAVIIVSGINRTQRVIDAMRVGAFDYLIKPCDLEVLSLSVERALERRVLLRNSLRYKRDLENRNAELAEQKAHLVRLQAQMVHAEKMASLGLLAAGVAHELNNPAGFIYSNIDVLRLYVERLERCLFAYERLTLTADDADRIARLKTEVDYDNVVDELGAVLSDCYLGAQRIKDVVQNLRLFSRLDEAEVKEIDIHEGIEATVRLLAHYFKSGGIALERDYGELPRVNCYAAQLNQVWMNLLMNAVQAIGNADGRIRIRTRHVDEIVRVEISDNGGGISANDLKSIFDPFFTTKPVGEGTGLGLAIVHGIVQQHGGDITIDTVAGQGTTFGVSLPIDIETVKLTLNR
jgi:signal transduction histidine kinase